MKIHSDQQWCMVCVSKLCNTNHYGIDLLYFWLTFDWRRSLRAYLQFVSLCYHQHVNHTAEHRDFVILSTVFFSMLCFVECIGSNPSSKCWKERSSTTVRLVNAWRQYTSLSFVTKWKIAIEITTPWRLI